MLLTIYVPQGTLFGVHWSILAKFQELKAKFKTYLGDFGYVSQFANLA